MQRSLFSGVVLILMTSILAVDGEWSYGASGAGRVRIWNGDVMAPYRDVDFDAGTRRVGPIKIVGVRRGTFSGKVVLGSTKSIKGVTARVTDLVSKKGRIRASAIRIGFPPYSSRGAYRSVAKAVPLFDNLHPKQTESKLITRSPDRKRIKYIPMNHAFQPVWITVTIPPGAAAGDYRGTLTIRAKGARQFRVPVKLTLHAWTLPKPDEYATFVEFIQSPESVAIKYGARLWSKKHFKLMGRSLRLMGEIGSRSIYIPLICETNMGNDESMVRWKKQKDGTFSYDFSVMEKYLDAVEKHMGKPRIVGLYVWDTFLEGGQFHNLAGGGKGIHGEEAARKDWKSHQGKGPSVTIIKNRKVGKLSLPLYSSPKSAAVWKPMLIELRDRLKKRGLDKAMMWGIGTDYVPAKEVVKHFAEILPGVPWIHHSHSFYGGRDRKIAAGGSRVAYASHVWCHRARIDPSKKRHYGWRLGTGDNGIIATHYHRGLWENGEIGTYRLLIEMNLAAGKAGIGRMGADFWPVFKNSRGQLVGRISDGRFPKSMWRNLNIRVAMFAAGPHGAERTSRYEMMREGVQECEARIFIEKALLDAASRKKLGKQLADKCHAVLDERTRMIMKAFLRERRGKKYQGDNVNENGNEVYLKWNWQKRSGELYSAAAEVAARLAKQ